MIYLSGVSTPGLRAVLPHRSLGLMWTPAAYTDAQHVPGAVYAADNGCFTLGERFDPGVWLGWLARLNRRGCLFAVAPDVVGDAAATLARSAPYFDRLRRLGYRVGYALQNGQEHQPMPWTDIDAVFIGGDTAWKLSAHAARAGLRRQRPRQVGPHGPGQQPQTTTACSGNGLRLRRRHLPALRPTTNLPRMLAWLHQLAQTPVLDLNNPPPVARPEVA